MSYFYDLFCLSYCFDIYNKKSLKKLFRLPIMIMLNEL